MPFVTRNVGYDTAFFFPAWYVYLFIFNAVLLHAVCIVTPVNNDRESWSGYVTREKRKKEMKERKKKKRNVRREELFRDLAAVFSPGKRSSQDCENDGHSRWYASAACCCCYHCCCCYCCYRCCYRYSYKFREHAGRFVAHSLTRMHTYLIRISNLKII